MAQVKMGNSGSYPSADELAYHKLYRDRVVNEDSLIYHRLSWFLGTQTILFVLWAAVLKDPASSHSSFRSATIGICLFGIVSCAVSFLGVWAALSEIKHLQTSYDKHNPNPHPKLPSIVGNPDHHLIGKLPPYLLIVAVVAGWLSVWAFFT